MAYPGSEMRARSIFLFAAVCGAGVFGLAVSSSETPLSVLDHSSATAVVKLEFGLKHAQPRRWRGSASVSAGEILSAWGWNFSRPDRIEGQSGWDFQARLFSPPEARYRPRWELSKGVQILPNGVYLSVKAPGTAELSVKTNHGDFSFRLSELKDAGRVAFVDGDVHAVYTPAVRPLTRGEASQHDFPAVVAVGDDLYVAWTTYHNEANVLYLARRRGGEWSTHRVTSAWGDYYGTAAAADGNGVVHVIWSEYKEDRWRLVDRMFDPAKGEFGPARYVAPAGRRQMFPQATTDAAGKAWVVWQEFARENLDVLAAWWDGERWSEPLRVSESEANDWAPSIAAAPDGAVWIAWDAYEAGNYDVFLRAIRNGRLKPAIQVTHGLTFDAHASVAVDPQNRVWVAWAEGGPNWGKDWGVLGRPGTQIRASSRIRLARYAEGRWSEPKTLLEDAVPAWMSDLHEYPHLAIGPNGLPYVFFRKSIHRIPIEEHALKLKFGERERFLQPWYDTIRGMSSIQMIGFDGATWLPVRELPLSEGGAFAQSGAALLGDRLAFVWPSDGRSYEDPHFRTSQLRYAEFDLSERPAERDDMQPFVSEPEGAPDAAPTEAQDLARVRAARWDDKQPLRLFRGDLHRHTDLSADSQRDGDILMQYRYALDAGALDFLAVTDHSGAERMHFYKYQWWRTRQIATMFNKPGRFATFFGYERTVTYPGGHRNVISTRRDMQPVPISDEEFTGVESWAERLDPSLIANGDIAIAHTTAGGGGTDWRDGDPRAEPVVEVLQALRGSYEEPNSPAARGDKPEGYVWNAWKKGRKIGLIANSDHQSTHQSYACVYAPELTAEAIHMGIKQRLTFAASDNIVLQFEAVTPDGEIHKMGSEVVSDSTPELRIRIDGTAQIEKLEVIRNGEILHSISPGSSSVRLSYRDNDPLTEEAYYNVRLVQKNKQIAWSSPIWVRMR